MTFSKRQKALKRDISNDTFENLICNYPGTLGIKGTSEAVNGRRKKVKSSFIPESTSIEINLILEMNFKGSWLALPVFKCLQHPPKLQSKCPSFSNVFMKNRRNSVTIESFHFLIKMLEACLCSTVLTVAKLVRYENVANPGTMDMKIINAFGSDCKGIMWRLGSHSRKALHYLMRH